MATEPTLRQRRQYMAMVQLTRPERLWRYLVFTGVAVVGWTFLVVRADHSVPIATVEVALLTLALLIMQFYVLTAEAAVSLPGCPFRETSALKTPRLRIRPVEPQDAGPYAATVDDEFRRENGWTQSTETDWIRCLCSPLGLAKSMGYFVIERADGEIVGGLSAQLVDRAMAFQLGWWVRPDQRRQGYAKEAVIAFAAGLHREGAERLIFGTRTTNVANHRLAAAIGATSLGPSLFALPNGEQVESDWFLIE